MCLCAFACLGAFSFPDGCDKKRCDFYAVCETDEMGRADCICPKGCSKVRPCPLGIQIDSTMNDDDDDDDHLFSSLEMRKCAGRTASLTETSAS